ncbi:MAG: hypothetical protein ABIH68_08380 [bacterium]
MKNSNVAAPASGKKKFFVMVLVLGSVCGLMEVVLGGLLHHGFFHQFRSAILTGLGLGIIGFGLAILRKPGIAVLIGLVTVLSKQLVVPILGVSVMCKMNSCLAVMLEFGGFFALAAITMNKMKKSPGMRSLTAGAGVLSGSIAYYFIGMRVAPCAYMLSFNRAGGFISFMAAQGLLWAAFSAVLFPLGWLAGEKYREGVFALSQSPRLFYAGASAIVIFCWIVSAAAISLGI